MRILIIPACYPLTPDDFAGVFVRDQARLLALKHEVIVLAPQLLTLRRWLVKIIKPAAEIPPADPCGVHEYIVKIHNLTNCWEWLTWLLWQRRMHKFARQLLASTPPDLVHAHFMQPSGLVALRLARLWQVPVILTEHSGHFAEQITPGWRQKEASHVLKGVNAVVAVSPGLRSKIQSHFPWLEIGVLGNVVDEEYFRPSARALAIHHDRPFRFLFIGRLVTEKGLDYLLESAAQLMNSHAPRDWNLEIAGDGPLKAELECKVKKLGLGLKVHLSGHLVRTKVLARLQQADALVLPSVAETFGVVLIEAMACGLPVIATRCAGPSWIVETDTGLLVPPGDVAALTKALGEMLEHSDQFDRDTIRNRVISRFGRGAWLAGCETIYRALNQESPSSHSSQPNPPAI